MFVALLVIGALCAVPAVASATVTSTTITSPAEKTAALWDETTATGSLMISGVAPGASDGDLVDIRCFGFSGYSGVAATDVAVSGGQFAAQVNDLSDIAGSVCRLRAIPAGSKPGDTDPYSGPLVAISSTRVSKDNPYDSSNPKANDYSVYGEQFSGEMGWSSAGTWGLGSRLFDVAAGTQTPSVFDSAHYFNGSNSPNTQSPIQIDGNNGWLASNLYGAALENESNFPELTLSHEFDPATGNQIATASEGLITCTDDHFSWWISGQECPPIIATGVRLDRKITQSHGGRKGIVRDRWVSTDGNEHTISLEYLERFGLDSGNSPDARFEFPGKDPIDGATDGQIVDGPFTDGGTIYVHDPSFADGSKEVGRAAITMGTGADSAYFLTEGYTPSFRLVYANRTIPAGGALELTTTFYQDYAQADLEALVAGAPDVQPAAPGGKTPATPAKPAKPSLAGDLKVKATASKGKKPRVTLATDRSVSCPAGGSACSVTVKLTTKVTKRKKGMKRVTVVKLGTFTFAVLPGTSKKLTYTLAAKYSALFGGGRTLKIAAAIAADAGAGTEISGSDDYRVKSPKFK